MSQPIQFPSSTAGLLGVKQCFHLLHGIGVARDPVIDGVIRTIYAASQSVNSVQYSTLPFDLGSR